MRHDNCLDPLPHDLADHRGGGQAGRVVSLYTMTFMGMVPFGSLMGGGLALPLLRRITAPFYRSGHHQGCANRSAVVLSLRCHEHGRNRLPIVLAGMHVLFFLSEPAFQIEGTEIGHFHLKS